MSITGTARLIFGVENLELCSQFYEDFGLIAIVKSDEKTVFELEEGSQVELRKIDDPALPKAYFEGSCVRETIWGVDSQENLDKLESDLRSDRNVTKDDDGTLHFTGDCKTPMGLMLFNPKPIIGAPDPINSPGSIFRYNVMRKWRKYARPKNIQHVVYFVEDADAAWHFYRDRLGFRLADISRGLGYFARADGRREHHHIFLCQTGTVPGSEKPRFDHVNFGVEDMDEMMIGTNHMARRGWLATDDRLGGFGRHRISSALFSYINCPAGGKAEYGADTDYLDDSWMPRIWNGLFGSAVWTAKIPDYMKNEPPWEYRFVRDDDTFRSS